MSRRNIKKQPSDNVNYRLEAVNTLTSVSRSKLYFTGETFSLEESQAKPYTYSDARLALNCTAINRLKHKGVIGRVQIAEISRAISCKSQQRKSINQPIEQGSIC